jgi:hypothetical protein
MSDQTRQTSTKKQRAICFDQFTWEQMLEIDVTDVLPAMRADHREYSRDDCGLSYD